MTKPSPFKWFKTSPEIIRLAVMLYVRFPLSLRNVEDLLHERGVDVSHETVRFWWHRFGPMFANEIRKRRIEGMKSSRWRWHLDEMFVKINGERHDLWRAVDHEGEVLESFVTKTRDKKAAFKFLKKAMRKHGLPKAIVMYKLRSYGAALKEFGAGDRQETARWLNDRAENTHLPFRRRERAMLRFRRMRSLQKFAAVHASVLCLTSALPGQILGFEQRRISLRGPSVLVHRSHYGAKMNKRSGTSKDAADKLVRCIKRKTRKHYSAEEKIRIVLAGLRGEESISALCRREGIAESLYYSWLKEFLEAGKARLSGDPPTCGIRLSQLVNHFQEAIHVSLSKSS